MSESPHPLRSLLFLPGSVVVDPAHPLLDYYRRCVAELLPPEFRPDLFIVDLEDSVSARERTRAFRDVSRFLEQAGSALKVKFFLRVTGTQQLRDMEVELASNSVISGIVIPKVELCSLEQTAAPFWELDKPLWPSIETAKGFLDKREIVGRFRRRHLPPLPLGVIFGRDDLAASLRIDRDCLTPQGFGAFFLDFVCACRAESCDPIGPVFNSTINASLLVNELSQLRAMGFTGTLCVFPSQVREVNRVFTFADPELRRRYAAIEAGLVQAGEQGLGWIIYEGHKYDTADLPYIHYVLSKSTLP
jgi:citrate lyase beta subunit